uniref:Uncharacterized protein n=1 Tax=Eubacterium cellulosolvens (strain ATCC 43171 / JCM 9499 / 6) TaxID=633697 RepID=I5AQT2_EUBC6
MNAMNTQEQNDGDIKKTYFCKDDVKQYITSYPGRQETNGGKGCCRYHS